MVVGIELQREHPHLVALRESAEELGGRLATVPCVKPGANGVHTRIRLRGSLCAAPIRSGVPQHRRILALDVALHFDDNVTMVVTVRPCVER